MIIIRFRIHDKVLENIQRPIEKNIMYYANDLVYTTKELERKLMFELVVPIFNSMNNRIFFTLNPKVYENN